MERLYPALIIDALKNVRYPGNGKNIVELDMIETIFASTAIRYLFRSFLKNLPTHLLNRS